MPTLQAFVTPQPPVIIPSMSRGREREMEILSAGLASAGEETPLHVSRYTPQYRCTEPAADVAAIYRLADAARRYLRCVYTGNC